MISYKIILIALILATITFEGVSIAIAIDSGAVRPPMVYAGTANGLFFSTNTGATWDTCYLTGNLIFSVAVIPASTSETSLRTSLFTSRSAICSRPLLCRDTGANCGQSCQSLSLCASAYSSKFSRPFSPRATQAQSMPS